MTSTTLAPASPAFRLRPQVRRAVLTLHIVAGVGLLGDVAAILAINIRAATTPDPQLAASAYELLTMFPVLFGIPLSMTSLVTGLVLGLGSKWGVVRYRWVTVKLLLNVSVILVGALLIGPATEAMVAGRDGSEAVLIGASVYDVVALLLATGLSVFKPGRRRRP
jgi:phosphate/sulfate permease